MAELAQRVDPMGFCVDPPWSALGGRLEAKEWNEAEALVGELRDSNPGCRGDFHWCLLSLAEADLELAQGRRATAAGHYQRALEWATLHGFTPQVERAQRGFERCEARARTR